MATARPPAPTLAELSPMLLEERRAVPQGDWHFEIKYDGYRLLAGSSPARLKSRNGHDATAWYPEVAAAVGNLKARCIFDGEVCVLDEHGRSDFELLHRRSARRGKPPGSHHVAYCVFDLLVNGGRDMREQPIEKRKAALRKILGCCPDTLLFVDWVEDGDWLYQQALALRLEGIVAKRAGSAYAAGKRSSDWIKVKRPGAVPAERFKR
jgi:bifunctional non-homologous end joining protein LigD